jgi:peptidoglycan/LPS O-acetylase OafA/YrhL
MQGGSPWQDLTTTYEGNDLPQSLAASFDPRKNSLNAVRLLLAALVIVSHSWPLGGFGRDPQFGELNLGRWSVAGFFAISGYLITSSRDHTGFARYLWRRLLRIYPGFLVSLVVVAFVLAPLAAVIGPGHFASGDGLSFVWHNAELYVRQKSIGDTLASVPHRHSWNGAMWTLFYEFLCYLGVGAAVSLLPRRVLPAAVTAAFVVSSVSPHVLELTGRPVPTPVHHLSVLTPFFIAGAVLYLYGRHIPFHAGIAAVSAGALTFIMMTGIDSNLAALPLAYVCMWLGTVLPLSHIGKRNDLSYGLYIYGFPVQQMLALLGGVAFGVAPYIAASILLTVPFAAASWFIVERPAQRLKNAASGITPWWSRGAEQQEARV